MKIRQKKDVTIPIYKTPRLFKKLQDEKNVRLTADAGIKNAFLGLPKNSIKNTVRGGIFSAASNYVRLLEFHRVCYKIFSYHESNLEDNRMVKLS